MKRLSDTSTSETLKKFVAALKKSTKRLIRRRLGCTRPPPTDDGDSGTARLRAEIGMLRAENRDLKEREALRRGGGGSSLTSGSIYFRHVANVGAVAGGGAEGAGAGSGAGGGGGGGGGGGTDCAIGTPLRAIDGLSSDESTHGAGGARS